MTPTFDYLGLLQPPEKMVMTLEEFEQIFVHSFPNSQTREVIFENYRKFVDDFSELVSPQFIHWVNGSFVTQKINPRDIDFVMIIDYDKVELNRKLIDERFRRQGARTHYDFLDVYLVEKYPLGHFDYPIFEFEKAKWTDWFTKTRVNRAGVKFPKGFIEINF